MTCVLQSKTTPLIYAAQRGHSTVVDALVKAGADVNAADKVCVLVSRWLRLLSPFVCVVKETKSISDQHSKYPPLPLYFP